MNQSVMPSRHRFRWSVADITVTAVIAVASGIVFWAIGFIYAPIGSVLDIVPGASDLLNGFYYIAGPLAMIIVRKPGAALFAEMVAAVLEALLGSQWGGAGTVLPGLLQGLGAELAFALCAYGVWNMAITALSGALSALGGFTASWMLYGMGKSGLVLTVGIVCNVLSGAVVAGVLMWVLYRGLAGTGALERLAGGRAAVKAAAPVVADPEA